MTVSSTVGPTTHMINPRTLWMSQARMAGRNTFVMLTQTAVGFIETCFVGKPGLDALAAYGALMVLARIVKT